MLDDDVQRNPQRLAPAVDADPVAAEHAADAAAGAQPDDAVAPEGRLGDDLGNRLAGDRETAVLQVQRQVVGHG